MSAPSAETMTNMPPFKKGDAVRVSKSFRPHWGLSKQFVSKYDVLYCLTVRKEADYYQVFVSEIKGEPERSWLFYINSKYLEPLYSNSF